MFYTFWWFGNRVFTAYPCGDAGTLDAAGVYCFARWEVNGYRALYFGKTECFRDRPLGPGHEHWREAQHLGMSTILIHYEPSELRRSGIEAELIRAFPTPINDRLNRERAFARSVVARRSALSAALTATSGPIGARDCAASIYDASSLPSAADVYGLPYDRRW